MSVDLRGQAPMPRSGLVHPPSLPVAFAVAEKMSTRGEWQEGPALPSSGSRAHFDHSALRRSPPD